VKIFKGVQFTPFLNLAKTYFTCTRLDIAFVVNVLGRYSRIFPQSLQF